jgi:serine/threonine-protein kinase HipA
MAETAYVWAWLAGAKEPVVLGRLDADGTTITFTYGRTYLDRPDATPLYLPELPLEVGPQQPLSGQMPGCIADAGPDAWGRRVIEYRRATATHDLSPLGYLLASSSDRIGALDFQVSSEEYIPRGAGAATLEDLARAAERVEAGEPLPEQLDEALLHCSSVGGARPKALLMDGTRALIAKFSSSTDTYPVVEAEYIAMELARRCGLAVAGVELTETLGRRVLLVERFDRNADGTRIALVSALTLLELHDADGIAGRYGTYTELADQIRARFTDPDRTLQELFSRIAFNILVGNYDDHPRNHAAFWNGTDESLALTPAYDVCPQLRDVGEVAQAMAYGPQGERTSQVAPLAASAAVYHLTEDQARGIIDWQIETIRSKWDEVCDAARIPTVSRKRLLDRQFLNPYALYGWL